MRMINFGDHQNKHLSIIGFKLNCSLYMLSLQITFQIQIAIEPAPFGIASLVFIFTICLHTLTQCDSQ